MMRKGSGLARRHGEGLAEAVRQGLADETPLPVAPVREKVERGDTLRGRDAERLLARLKQWRNDITARDNMAPITVAANGLLREITRRAPRTLDDLSRVPEIRAWQIEAHGDTLVALVNEVLEDITTSTPPASDEGGAPPKKRRRRRRRPPSAEPQTA
jgi:ribonuclease D